MEIEPPTCRFCHVATTNSKAQVPTLCPEFAKRVLPEFDTPLAQLSKVLSSFSKKTLNMTFQVGIAENWESGVFLRRRYIPHFIPEAFVVCLTLWFFLAALLQPLYTFCFAARWVGEFLR